VIHRYAHKLWHISLLLLPLLQWNLKLSKSVNPGVTLCSVIGRQCSVGSLTLASHSMRGDCSPASDAAACRKQQQGRHILCVTDSCACYMLYKCCMLEARKATHKVHLYGIRQCGLSPTHSSCSCCMWQTPDAAAHCSMLSLLLVSSS
jgi:hypothetical protein